MPRSTKLVLLLLLFVAACRRDGQNPPPVVEKVGLDHAVGSAASEVTTESAIVWARAEGPADILLEVGEGEARQRLSAAAVPDRDFTVRFDVGGLAPATRYRYTLRVGSDAPLEGEFVTAPPPTDKAPVQFVFGGDLGGQNICRDRRRGFPLIEQLGNERADFFIALGDMIYADDICRDTGAFGNAQVAGDFGPAQTTAEFWAHWHYNRSDPHLRALLATTPYYPVWDDHEVANDFGPSSPRMQNGLAAFRHYNPLRAPETHRFYRSQRWGAHLELFFLDTRQYRDRNQRPDHQSKPKTMLGTEQRDWLVRGVAGSDATWKVVVSSVPLSIPTGEPDARDGWADGGSQTGFEREATRVLSELAGLGVQNLVWLTTDVHFATAFRYRPFESHPEFEFHEFVVGPLMAGLFPTRDLDDSLAPERLFFHGPETAAAAADGGFDTALHWMNYGVIAIDAAGALLVRVEAGSGERVFELELPPQSSEDTIAR